MFDDRPYQGSPGSAAVLNGLSIVRPGSRSLFDQFFHTRVDR